MRRETQNILLLLLGGALFKIAVTGTYLRYVKPSLLPWLILTALVMITLAGVAIVGDVRGRRVQHEHGSRSPWMLALPVFAIFLVAPPALGADSVNRQRVVVPSQPAESRFPALPPGQPVLSMSEFVTRAVWDDTGEMATHTIRLQGFVAHPGPGQTQLARMRISCCAADAAPIKVNLANVGALPDDTWLEVTARLRPGSATEANDFVPTVQVLESHPIPIPRDPYEY